MVADCCRLWLKDLKCKNDTTINIFPIIICQLNQQTSRNCTSLKFPGIHTESAVMTNMLARQETFRVSPCKYVVPWLICILFNVGWTHCNRDTLPGRIWGSSDDWWQCKLIHNIPDLQECNDMYHESAKNYHPILPVGSAGIGFRASVSSHTVIVGQITLEAN